MRALVLSDLHLGLRGGGDVLRADAQALRTLTDALTGIERLVLLGDVIELRQGPVHLALAAAEPVLRALGGALPAGARVTVVPGNHDHRLLAPWLQRRGADGLPGSLGTESAVGWRCDEPLERVVRWLSAGGGEVDVAYPGTWLRDDVYATHGHYSDRHITIPMLERIGAGAMARIAGGSGGGAAGPRSAEEYEAVLGPMYAWLDALAQTGSARSGVSAGAWHALSADGRGSLRRRAAGLAFPLAVAVLNRAGLGPLRADVSSHALRRARLEAMGEVSIRLAVAARHVVFGHSHRAGPLPADAPAEWRTAAGVALTNAGCWVRDRAFLGDDPARSPYRPGFAVVVDDDGPPRLVNLLERAPG